MPYSMTGYGRYAAKNDLYDITIELRSVNHRFLDISFRLPKNYFWLEEGCSKVLKSIFNRGKIDVSIQIKTNNDHLKYEVKINQHLLQGYLQSLKQAKRVFGIPGRIKIKDILQIPDVFFFFEPEEDQEAMKELIQTVMEKAASELLTMRKSEGEIISRDLLERIKKLQVEINTIEEVARELPEVYREKLKNRLQELSAEVVIDENRLAAEILLYVDRSSITEEIVRFKSHLTQFAATLELSQPIGRKLDFLTQELHREINTIAAKSAELIISQHVVEIKSEIEKIREQVQNIE